ncbi:right-handed parallel beta-helix repeat-containing protein [Phenylobacterium sp.]|uniref:right-handed parallel beta-helix repeat-containing protein n=1 Tax=Phenylobacterium sp. TaxID=1871053 RepID=UPI0025DD8D54|nr:right-handed parallel beta-helix repeat-containing protein [Phenylobacterium sp.]
MSIAVNSVSGLNAALNTAKGGETIVLSAGNYEGLTISGLHFDSAVTITSLSDTNEAVLKALSIKNSSGLQFQNLEFVTDAEKNPYFNFRVEGSSDITFDHLDVHGSLDGNPQNDAFAFAITASNNIKVTNSEFHEVGVGINHFNSNNLTIADNNFHGIRWDGIDGGGSSNVTISRNAFSDFHPREGEHPDAIQFWTTNTTVSASNIVVNDNLIERGAGIPIQGIFFQDEVGNLPFHGVTITRNLVVGESYNGIVVKHATDVTVENNEVVALPDQSSYITIRDVEGAMITGNRSTFLQYLNDTAVHDSGNLKTTTTTDGGAAAVGSWLAAHAIGPQMVTFAGVETAGPVASLDSSVTVNLVSTVAQTTSIAATAVVAGDAANNLIVGTAADDKLSGMGGADTLKGAAGNDVISGGDGDDLIYGNQGADTLSGGAGADRLTGAEGDDYLSGGASADTLEAGAGADLMSGGEGADIFIFREGDTLASAPDRILDFAHGDKISLTMVDANVNASGDQAFTFIGAQSFHHKAGELHYEVANGGIYLSGDTNGDGIADIKLFLDGLKSISVGDMWI